MRPSWRSLTVGAVLVVDEAVLDPETPLIMYGVRGNVSLEGEVRGPAHDLHSEISGGAVDNPFNVLARLLAQCQDADTRRITIPGFYDQVCPLSDDERALLAGLPVTDDGGIETLIHYYRLIAAQSEGGL